MLSSNFFLFFPEFDGAFLVPDHIVEAVDAH